MMALMNDDREIRETRSRCRCLRLSYRCRTTDHGHVAFQSWSLCPCTVIYRYRYRTTGHAHKPTIMTTTEAWPVMGADRRITMMTTKAWPVTIEPVRQQRHGPYLRVGFCGDWMTPTEAWPVTNRNDDLNKGMARSNQQRHGPYSDLGRIGG